MSTIKDMAFDYSMQRGHGRKSYEHFYAGARAVMRQILAAYDLGGIAPMVDCINSLAAELREKEGTV